MRVELEVHGNDFYRSQCQTAHPIPMTTPYSCSHLPRYCYYQFPTQNSEAGVRFQPIQSAYWWQ